MKIPWVCIFLMVVNVCVYFLVPKEKLDCSMRAEPIMARAFMHANLVHLLSNLGGLLLLMQFENQIGSAKFLIGVVAVYFLTVALEPVVYALVKQPCAIGFSGVVLGLLIWSLADTKLIAARIALILLYSYVSPRVSFWGHLTGIIAGLIVYAFYRPHVKPDSSPADASQPDAGQPDSSQPDSSPAESSQASDDWNSGSDDA